MGDVKNVRHPVDYPKKIKKPPSDYTSWQGKRTIIYKRDGFKCVYCGTKDYLTLDHILPKSKGGTNALRNLQTLCSACNGFKSSILEGDIQIGELYDHIIYGRKLIWNPVKGVHVKDVSYNRRKVRRDKIHKGITVKKLPDRYYSEKKRKGKYLPIADYHSKLNPFVPLTS